MSFEWISKCTVLEKKSGTVWGLSATHMYANLHHDTYVYVTEYDMYYKKP